MYEGNNGITYSRVTVLIRAGLNWYVRVVDVDRVGGWTGDYYPQFHVGIVKVGQDNTFTIVDTPENETGTICPSLSITLSWENTNENLNLIVYEPDLKIVKQGSNNGNLGTLSPDVLNGGDRGEIYAINCLQEPGIYTIAVNYFSGQAPTVGKIEIKVGNQTYNH